MPCTRRKGVRLFTFLETKQIRGNAWENITMPCHGRKD